MSRIARIIAPGFPHHITQRGNYGQTIFQCDADRKQYLQWVQEYSEKYSLVNLAFCLMTNHVHFISTPQDLDGMARTFNTAHMRYSQYMNKKRGLKGHLWQGRFSSYVMDEVHLMMAARYIERNPVRAGIVKDPWQWKWSSARNHIGEVNVKLLRLGNLFECIEMDRRKWKKFLSKKEDGDVIKQVDNSLISGKPLAEEKFVKKLEIKLNRKLFSLPRGRPKKEKGK